MPVPSGARGWPGAPCDQVRSQAAELHERRVSGRSAGADHCLHHGTGLHPDLLDGRLLAKRGRERARAQARQEPMRHLANFCKRVDTPYGADGQYMSECSPLPKSSRRWGVAVDQSPRSTALGQTNQSQQKVIRRWQH